jgi:hypothetical protein
MDGRREEKCRWLQQKERKFKEDSLPLRKSVQWISTEKKYLQEKINSPKKKLRNKKAEFFLSL